MSSPSAYDLVKQMAGTPTPAQDTTTPGEGQSFDLVKQMAGMDQAMPLANATVAPGSVGVPLSRVGTELTKSLANHPDRLPYVAYAEQVAKKNGLDPNIFLSQINQESGFNPGATSKVGARGIAQFMPGTAQGMGLADPSDPYRSLDAAGKLMAGHLKQFGGSYKDALAAYNAGAGAVQKYGGVPPYAETKGYVTNILKRAGASAQAVNAPAPTSTVQQAKHDWIKAESEKSPDAAKYRAAYTAALAQSKHVGAPANQSGASGGIFNPARGPMSQGGKPYVATGWEKLPFTQAAYQHALDIGATSVPLANDPTGRSLYPMNAAINVVKRVVGNGAEQSPLTANQQEMRQEEPASLNPPFLKQSAMQTTAHGGQIPSVGQILSEEYTKATGLTPEDAPGAHAALGLLGFVGDAAISGGVLPNAQMAEGVANNPKGPLAGTIETGKGLAEGANIFAAKDPGDFAVKSINLVLTVLGAVHGYHALSDEIKAAPIHATNTILSAFDSARKQGAPNVDQAFLKIEPELTKAVNDAPDGPAKEQAQSAIQKFQGVKTNEKASTQGQEPISTKEGSTQNANEEANGTGRGRPAKQAKPVSGTQDTGAELLGAHTVPLAEFVKNRPQPHSGYEADTVEKLAKNAPDEGKPGLNKEPYYVSNNAKRNGNAAPYPKGEEPGSVNYVYRDGDGKPVGILQYNHSGFEDQKPSLVVAVDPARRRQGIASLLYSYAAADGIPVEKIIGNGGLTEEGAKFQHGRAVKSAIARGENVPENVLKDYPNLKEQVNEHGQHGTGQSVEQQAKPVRGTQPVSSAEERPDGTETPTNEQGGEASAKPGQGKQPEVGQTADVLKPAHLAEAEALLAKTRERAEAPKPLRSGLDPTKLTDEQLKAKHDDLNLKVLGQNATRDEVQDFQAVRKEIANRKPPVENAKPVNVKPPYDSEDARRTLLKLDPNDPRLDPFSDEAHPKLIKAIEHAFGDGSNKPAHQLLEEAQNREFANGHPSEIEAHDAERRQNTYEEIGQYFSGDDTPGKLVRGTDGSFTRWVRKRDGTFKRAGGGPVGAVNSDHFPEHVNNLLRNYVLNEYRDPEYYVTRVGSQAEYNAKTTSGASKGSHFKTLSELAMQDDGGKAQQWPVPILRSFVEDRGIPLRNPKNSRILKAAAKELDLTDEELQDAIDFHTAGTAEEATPVRTNAEPVSVSAGARQRPAETRQTEAQLGTNPRVVSKGKHWTVDFGQGVTADVPKDEVRSRPELVDKAKEQIRTTDRRAQLKDQQRAVIQEGRKGTAVSQWENAKPIQRSGFEFKPNTNGMWAWFKDDKQLSGAYDPRRFEFHATPEEASKAMWEPRLDAMLPKESPPSQPFNTHPDYERLNRIYGKLTEQEINDRINQMSAQIKDFQKQSTREFNGNGGRRTGPAVSMQAARDLGHEKMLVNIYKEDKFGTMDVGRPNEASKPSTPQVTEKPGAAPTKLTADVLRQQLGEDLDRQRNAAAHQVMLHGSDRIKQIFPNWDGTEKGLAAQMREWMTKPVAKLGKDIARYKAKGIDVNTSTVRESLNRKGFYGDSPQADALRKSLLDFYNVLKDEHKALDPTGRRIESIRQADELERKAANEKPPDVVKSSETAPNKGGEKPALSVDKPYTIADHKEIVKRIKDGTITADEYKQQFKRLMDSEAAIKAEVNAKPMKDWYRGGKVPSGVTKQGLANGIFRNLRDDYQHGTFSYMMGEDSTAAFERHVNEITDEEIQKNAAERKQKLADMQESIDNPKSVDDYERLMRVKGKDALTPEQRADYERLQAEQGIDRRQGQKERAATVAQVKQGDVGMTLKEGYHTKHRVPLHIVQLDTRVDGDTFKELAQKARMLGGNYSSFGPMDQRGFQFRDKANAERFMSLKDENVSRAEDVQARQQEAQQNTAERLRTQAENMEARADESLNQDRRANTARQARMAANAEADARYQKALAGTLQRVADAIEKGKAKMLSGIRAKTHIETLEVALSQARNKAMREAKERFTDGQGNASARPVQESDIAHAEYPYPYINKRMLLGMSEELKNKPGFKMDAAALAKAAKHISEDGVDVKNSAFIDRLNKIVRKAPAGKYSEVGNYARHLEDYNRLHAANIHNEAELRTALREYFPLREAAAAEDPIKSMERDLVGQKIPGFFPTPKPLIDRMVEAADIKPGDKVLEPSAGKGDIADALRDAGADVHTAETNSSLRAILKAKGYDPEGDFLETPKEPTYDKIVMNPPFENRQDVAHVQAAYDRLKPGGKLVAIMSEGPFFGSDAKAVAFRQWLEDHGGTSEKNPEGSFQGNESFRQTGTNTRMVEIEKPAASGNKIFTDEAKAAAEKVLREGRKNPPPGGKQSGAINLTPEEVKAAVTIGGWHVERGIRDFGAWSKAMVEHVGDWIEPHLKDIWDKVQATMGTRAPEGTANAIDAHATQIGQNPSKYENAASTVERTPTELQAEAKAKSAALRGGEAAPNAGTVDSGTGNGAPTERTEVSAPGENANTPPERPNEKLVAAARNAFTEPQGIYDKGVFVTPKMAFEAGQKVLAEKPGAGMALADELASKPREVSAQEIGVLTAHQAVLEAARRRTLQEMAQANKDGRDTLGIQARLKMWEDLKARNMEALQKVGRLQSSAFMARTMGVGDDMEYAALKTEWDAKHPGRDIDPTTDARLRDLSRQHEETLAQLDKAMAENERLKAENALKQTAPRAARSKKSLEELAEERKEILKEFGKAYHKVSFNPFLDPEIYKPLGKLARNLGETLYRSGELNLKKLISSMRDELGPDAVDFTDEDLHRAISGNFPKSPKQRSEAEIEFAKVQKEARLRSDVASFKRQMETHEAEEVLPKRQKDVLTPQMEQLLKKRDMLRNQAKAMVEAGAPKTGGQKAASYLSNGVISGLSFVSKLGGASAWKLATEPIETLVGAAAGKITSKGVPLERLGASEAGTPQGFLAGIKGAGQFAKDITKGRIQRESIPETEGKTRIVLTPGDSVLLQQLRHGYDWIDAASGKIPSEGKFVGRIHGAYKGLLKQATYQRAITNEFLAVKKMGLDPSNPDVIDAMRMRAALSAQNAILMDKNALSGQIGHAIDSMLTHKSAGVQAAGVVLHTLAPVRGVPLNYLKAFIDYTGVGPIRGALKQAGFKFEPSGKTILGRDIPKIGRSRVQLTPEEAADVLRAYKRGGPAAFAMYVGLTSPSFMKVGGWYTANQGKQTMGSDGKPLGPGEVEILGYRLPKIVAHSPFVEAAQFWATVGNLSDAMKGPKGHKVELNWQDKAGTLAKGLIDLTPGSMSISQMANKQYGAALLQPWVPAISRNIAEAMDKDEKGNVIKRSQAGITNPVVSGIPFARKTVPVATPKNKGTGHSRGLRISLK